MTPTPLPDWLDRTEFPFQPRLVDLGDDEVLSVTDVGTGPVAVFSHGTPTWSYEWRHHLLALASRFRCIAPDHLGFGLSTRPRSADYSPRAHARRFSRLLDVLGIARCHLVIHDFGGPIALEAALTQPGRVASVTAYNTFAWAFTDSARSRRLAWLAGTSPFRWAYGALNLSFVISRDAWGDGPQNLKPYLSVFPDSDSRRRVLWALAKSMRGSTPFFDSLWERRDRLASTPMHVIWGLRDSAFPASALRRFKEGFPHASVLELPRAGHWPHEEQPEDCVRSVDAFLSSLTG